MNSRGAWQLRGCAYTETLVLNHDYRWCHYNKSARVDLAEGVMNEMHCSRIGGAWRLLPRAGYRLLILIKEPFTL